ncbi:MAG: N-acetyl-gamma-glutamyl-phosphate reductase [Candidatus Omnitrophica bacterium]|jgi:N-acetyl-gamma-glutamyl-phosphate reductase|nr:N-acetyl-gamma-glutamyl-phosphate reductase [Candidatus Omnitrophota bacterium]
MIKAGIIGVTGYAGEVLIDILLNHPEVRIVNLSAKVAKPQQIAEIFPKLQNRIALICTEPDLEEINSQCDLVFLALPHTVSMQIVPKLLKAKKKVIDLSADYRLKNIKIYKKFYGVSHKDKANLKNAVYGLPEIYRNKIKQASFIANPGCYPTAAILALAPLAALNLIDLDSVIIDAKSGVTGAGRKPSEGLLFPEINEDFKAYKVNIHQHSPEINQVLSGLSRKAMEVTFVPHLLPLNQGILETIYVNKAKSAKPAKTKNLAELYKKFYKKEPFVRIKGEGLFPRIKDVVGANFCDIGIKDCGDKIIIISAIDNLIKGASGQAVQNMNIMYGFPETLGLL